MQSCKYRLHESPGFPKQLVKYSQIIIFNLIFSSKGYPFQTAYALGIISSKLNRSCPEVSKLPRWHPWADEVTSSNLGPLWSSLNPHPSGRTGSLLPTSQGPTRLLWFAPWTSGPSPYIYMSESWTGSQKKRRWICLKQIRNLRNQFLSCRGQHFSD